MLHFRYIYYTYFWCNARKVRILNLCSLSVSSLTTFSTYDILIRQNENDWTGFPKEFYNTTFEYLEDSIPLNEFSFTPTNFTLVLKIRLLEIRLDLNGEKHRNKSYPVDIDCEEVNIHLPSKTSSLTHFLPFLWKKKILNDDKASYCGGLPTLVY
jgi:hypothetical protein